MNYRLYSLLIVASLCFNLRTYWSVRSESGVEQSCPGDRVFNSLAFSRDSQFVAASWGDPPNPEIQIWEAKSGKAINVLAPQGLNYDNDIVFSPDDNYLAFTTGDDVNVQLEVLNIQSGESVNVIKLDTQQLYGIKLSFSADSHDVFVTGNNGIVEWEIQTGKPIRRFPATLGANITGVISPDTHYLAKINETSVTLWDLATNRQVLNVSNVSMEDAVTFSTDSKLIFIGASDRLIVMDTKSGTQTASFDPAESHGYRGIISPDNKYLLTHSALAFGDVITVWSLETEKEIYTYKPAGAAYPVQFSADSQHLLLVDASNDTSKPDHLRTIDFLSGRDVSNFIVGVETNNSAFSPDGKLYFSLQDNSQGTLRVWNVATGDNQVWC